MARRYAVSAALTLGLFLCGAQAASKPSKISAYAGKYTGTLTFTDGTSITGPSTAVFKASRRKEKGSLLLTSTLTTPGNSSIVFIERIDFNRRSVVYTLTQQTTGAPRVGGSAGSGSISRRTIRFSATFDFNNATITVNGTIHRGKRRLVVNDVLSSGGAVTLDYALATKRK